jgi:hypothetical protein
MPGRGRKRIALGRSTGWRPGLSLRWLSRSSQPRSCTEGSGLRHRNPRGSTPLGLGLLLTSRFRSNQVINRYGRLDPEIPQSAQDVAENKA